MEKSITAAPETTPSSGGYRTSWRSKGYEIKQGKDLSEAVLFLNGVDLAAPTAAALRPDYAPQQRETAPKELEIPTRAPDMRRTFRYLVVTRGIDYQIVRTLVKQGRIFETVKELPDGRVCHNVAFAGLDENGKIRSVPCGKDWNEYLQCWRAVVRRHSELPTTETDGPEGPTYGRIHYLEDDGTVGATLAYSDARRFASAVQKLRGPCVPFVAETPEQLRELNRSRCKASPCRR